MATGKIFDQRPYLSDVLASVSDEDIRQGLNFHFATAPVEGAETRSNIGIPLIWVEADGAFVRYTGQTIAAQTSNPLPDQSPFCISVGDKRGVGFDTEDVVLTATATDMTVVFRGDGGIKLSGIDFGAATQPQIDAFALQLEKQRLAIAKEATVLDNTNLSYI